MVEFIFYLIMIIVMVLSYRWGHREERAGKSERKKQLNEAISMCGDNFYIILEKLLVWMEGSLAIVDTEIITKDLSKLWDGFPSGSKIARFFDGSVKFLIEDTLDTRTPANYLQNTLLTEAFDKILKGNNPPLAFLRISSMVSADEGEFRKNGYKAIKEFMSGNKGALLRLNHFLNNDD